jgi:two-component system CheB/CheR fusion protein
LDEPADVAESETEQRARAVVEHHELTVGAEHDERLVLGTRITYVDVTPIKALQDELTHSKQELETAYEELQSTNEELETTNEELQSTNEELETMNEELQSTNEELQTVNGELQGRNDELKRASGFLESVLTGVRSGVAVLDRDLQVIAWNHRAQDMWGLRSEEAKGQNFLNLDIGLPTDELRGGIRACLTTDGSDGHFNEIVVQATNRRGKTIPCKVTTTPLRGP